MPDRFMAIKAQLDNINSDVERDANRGWELAAKMKTALEQISAIKDDSAGNGAELARQIAARAIDAYEQTA